MAENKNPVSIPALSFAETAIPTPAPADRGPNPFDGQFPTAEGKSLTSELPGSKEKNADLLVVLRRKATEAGDALTDEKGDPAPQTVRMKVSEKGSGAKAVTLVTVWTTGKKVRRERKPSDGK